MIAIALYLILATLTIFIIERTPSLRCYSPIQAFLFPAGSNSVKLNDLHTHQYRSPLYRVPITYYHLPSYSCGRPKGIVVYLHGNTGSIASSVEHLVVIQQKLNYLNYLKYEMISIEHPGYGTDVGNCRVTDYCMADRVITLLEHLALREEVKADNIILVGRSMGTGIATEVASRMRVQALVLISPYSSLNVIARELLGWFGFVSRLMGERFNNVKLMRIMQSPLLCIVGETDELIPMKHSLRLLLAHERYQKLSRRELVALKGGHNSISSSAIGESIRAFCTESSVQDNFVGP